MTEGHAAGEPQQPTQGEPRDSGAPFGDDTSGIDNLMEEGGPLEPEDLAESGEQKAAPAESEAETQLRERTADLQRLQAEYVNYKRRVERDRDVVRQGAVNGVLLAMLPVLDDIDRAREHGELEGGFKAVADSLERTVTGLGLVRYGAKGDEFDPTLHEALMHSESEDVETTVVDVVAQAGYKVGDRIVRAAKVTVVGPA